MPLLVKPQHEFPSRTRVCAGCGACRYARPPGLAPAANGSGLRADVDTGVDAEAWMVAVYDAALVGLCAALGLGQSLVDDTVCLNCERQRVELELLAAWLPLG